MDKEEVNYDKHKDKLKFKVKSTVEDPLLALKAEIEELKTASKSTKTKDFVTEKGSIRSCEITNRVKNTLKNEKLYKESNGKTYHWCETHRENDSLGVIHNQ